MNGAPTVQTFVDLLLLRAAQHPDRTAYTFLVDGETQTQSLTYRALDRRARAIAALLQSFCLPGDRVLLLYPPGLEYISAFFGCLYAGAVAVPAYPPRPNRTLERLQWMSVNAGARAALTSLPVLAGLEKQLTNAPDLKAIEWLATDRIPSTWGDLWRYPDPKGETLAFLQYTSGSTAAPKGVTICHDRLLHNSRAIYRSFQHSAASSVVSWLPVYHDMGLIGGVLQPLYGGFPATLMSPLMFLQRPVRWLEAIARYRATSSGGPNFAYSLCARKVTDEQKVDLDLSGWEVAFNGAEPIDPRVLEAFATAFAPCGFRREAFYPCYGLAEATLLVTGGSKADPPILKTLHAPAGEANGGKSKKVREQGDAETRHRDSSDVRTRGYRETSEDVGTRGRGDTLEDEEKEISPSPHLSLSTSSGIDGGEVDGRNAPEPPATRTVVGCGRSVPEQVLAIVDPETLTPCREGEVGEIWVSGPSVSSGYWQQPETNERTFRARLEIVPSDSKEGEGELGTSGSPDWDGKRSFLRTGDLGFLENGELFVTGRLKDLMIVNGCNYYPQDIEWTVERSHPLVRPGCTASFSIDLDGEERLVVVAEVERAATLQEERATSVDSATDSSEGAGIPTAREIIHSIQRAVTREHDLSVHAVLLLKAGSIPKTSSGKIQRSACRVGFLTGTL